MEKLIFTADDIDEGTEIRISEYLKTKCGFSHALITKVKFGGVFINGENVHMRATVKKGDTVVVNLPHEKSDIPPIDIPLNIIYEDDDMIAVDKPSNMPTHPSRGNSLPTLANALSAYFGEGFIFRSINRLDRDTSGIVLVAKNSYSAIKLYKKMRERGFVKKYVALVSGIPKEEHGVIDAPIEREAEGSIKRTVRLDGKPAVTEYKIIKKLPSGNSLCEITLHTGRTHQIRVHMAYIGHPLVDDFLYGEKMGEEYYLRCVRLGDITTDFPPYST